MPGINSVKDADVSGKRVLVRVDFNVPLDMHLGHAVVLADFRIRAVLPTLHILLDHGAAKILILTHVGRPEGKVVESLRVAPIAERLRELLPSDKIEVLENLRFDAREEKNDEAYTKELVALGDVYVNEAFPVSHRPDASIVGIPKFLPSYAGLRFEEEIINLQGALTPPKGSVAIIGGAKFETKVPLIKKLLEHYDMLLLGGALGNDVIKARGLPFGSSKISDTPVPPEVAQNERLLVPSDAIFSEVSSNAERSGLVVDIRANEMVIDIGPQTSRVWSELIAKAPFVLWNGPVGVYEKGYADGTDALAAALTTSAARAVVGGGDTAAAIEKHQFDPARVFISTGGGAMLQFLVDGTLPAIEALKNSAR